MRRQRKANSQNKLVKKNVRNHKSKGTRKKEKRTSVRKKILLIVLAIILCSGSLLTHTIMLGYKIDKQYSQVLTQISMSGQVVDNVRQIDAALSAHVLRQDNGADITQNPNLQEAERLIDELIQMTTNEDELFALDGVKRILETYRQTINAIAESMKNVEISKAIEHRDYTKKLEVFIADNMEDYIYIQLSRAEEMKQEIHQQFSRSIMITMFATITMLIVSISLLLKIVQGISKPLKQVCESADKVAKGDLTVDKLQVRTNDEIKNLADSFNQMIENVRHSIKDVQDMSAKVHTAALNLSTITKENSKVSEQISGSVSDMAEGIHVQSEQAGKIKDNIQKIYEITSQIDENDKKVLGNSNKSVDLANTGAQYSMQFMEKMQQINEKIKVSSETTQALNQRAKDVYNILAAMGNIATETHLLSLNASIEAARAGEEGRGFAIVAEQIRKLAAHSSEFAEQLRGIITMFESSLTEMNAQMLENVKYIEEGSQLAVKTQEFFNTIKAANDIVNRDIENNVKELEQLALKIKDVNEAVERNNEVVKGNESTSCSISAAIEQQLASIEELEAEAAELHELAANMEKSISVFTI